MPILFTCPHCGLQTNVADHFAGNSGPCSRCGKTVTVPFPTVMPGFAPPPKSGTNVLVIVLGVVIGVLVVCGGIGAVFYMRVSGSVGVAREAARRAQCSNNLKQIGIALHNYHDVYKCFPPAVVTDKDGRPMRSWRVAILPFVEQRPLYNMYDQNQPWDSAKNRIVSSTAIPAYRCPSSPQQPLTTDYVMIVGDKTIGGNPNEAISFKDITDGTSNTIAVVEVPGAAIPWSQPKDLTINEFFSRLDAVSQGSGNHPGGINVLMADGSVRFISSTIDRENLRRLLLRDDGVAVTEF